MKFYIINTSYVPLPINSTHILSIRKFAKGFQQLGYEIIELLSDDKIYQIENKKGNITILSNFGSIHPINIEKLNIFAKKYDNLFYILWYWINLPTPFKYWVHTFQEYKLEPYKEPYKNRYLTYKQYENVNKYIPYRFSSFVNPETNFIELNNNKDIDIIYIGSIYERQILQSINNNKNYNTFIHTINCEGKYITGNEFINLYRRSKICLGLMSKGNIDCNTVTERIWEAFSFGCLVLTNSKTAEIVTDGAAVYYSNYQDLLNKIDYYLSNKDEYMKKIEKGYNIFTSYGNYKYNANEFVNYLNNI
jgi:spore maturation protein CgeB